jgi:integrase
VEQGKLVGQKAPFKLKEIWAIRVRLQLFRRVRDLALFDLGSISKLRACDLVRLKVRDICHNDRVAARAIVMQQKTSRPVQFEITESTREAVAAWIKEAGLRSEDYLFPSRLHESLQAPHYSALRQECQLAKVSQVRRLVNAVRVQTDPLRNVQISKITPARLQSAAPKRPFAQGA